MKNLLILILFLNYFVSGDCQENRLPRPSGKYYVGVTYLSFVDYNRKELFDDKNEKYREITVKAWYPSDVKSEIEPYLLSPESDFAITHLQYTDLYSTLKSNSSRDVPVSSNRNNYPILIFSHGWGEHYSQNSIQMEELASHGYIVFSIAHHYECKFSSYPDGRLIYIDMNNQRLQKILVEMSGPKAIESIPKMFNAKNDEERIKVFEETSKAIHTALSEGPTYWAADISFFIDQLSEINKENIIFKRKLNQEMIGVFGMSMGGISSTEVSLSDRRVKACVSIDGGIYGSILQREAQIPLLFLNSKRYLGYGNLFSKKSTNDCYSLGVRNSDHYNFSDYSLYPVPAVQNLLGSIDGGTGEKIMNEILLGFFDKYLKKKNINLIKRVEQFSEIEIVTNL